MKTRLLLYHFYHNVYFTIFKQWLHMYINYIHIYMRHVIKKLQRFRVGAQRMSCACNRCRKSESCSTGLPVFVSHIRCRFGLFFFFCIPSRGTSCCRYTRSNSCWPSRVLSRNKFAVGVTTLLFMGIGLCFYPAVRRRRTSLT